MKTKMPRHCTPRRCDPGRGTRGCSVRAPSPERARPRAGCSAPGSPAFPGCGTNPANQAGPAGCREPGLHPKARRSLIQAGFCTRACLFPLSPSNTCCSGMWPSVIVRVPGLCLRPDFHAAQGAALQAGTGPEGFQFLSSSILRARPSSPHRRLPGGPLPL